MDLSIIGKAVGVADCDAAGRESMCRFWAAGIGTGVVMLGRAAGFIAGEAVTGEAVNEF